MLTDVLDGFFARRLNQVSTIGTIIDPLADKLFVAVALVAFYCEGTLQLNDIAAFLSREWALCLFTLFLLIQGKWSRYTIRAFIAGKVMTSLQFITLMLLAANFTAPPLLYGAMWLCGVLSLGELLLRDIGKARAKSI